MPEEDAAGEMFNPGASAAIQIPRQQYNIIKLWACMTFTAFYTGGCLIFDVAWTYLMRSKRDSPFALGAKMVIEF